MRCGPPPCCAAVFVFPPHQTEAHKQQTRCWATCCRPCVAADTRGARRRRPDAEALRRLTLEDVEKRLKAHDLGGLADAVWESIKQLRGVDTIRSPPALSWGGRATHAVVRDSPPPTAVRALTAARSASCPPSHTPTAAGTIGNTIRVRAALFGCWHGFGS